MIQTKDFKINSPVDVCKFFFWLLFDCKVNFHPDDDFSDYVSMDGKGKTFDDEQCDMYNKIMDDCFSVCKKHHRDIYDIANRVFLLYFYCNAL